MITSLIRPVGSLALPPFAGTRVYMQSHILGERVRIQDNPAFEDPIEKMLANVQDDGAKVFITIDQKLVLPGKTHRRPGAHVDGNFIFSWSSGGGGWLTGENGRVLSPENHKLQYVNPMGGMLIVSDYQACRAWVGEIDDEPGQGGNCAHMADKLKTLESFLLDPNQVYLGNSTCVHESLPIQEEVQRTLIRITLAPSFKLN